MRILVLGGYGLIGGYVTAALAGAGHEVIGVGRDIAEAARRFPGVGWARGDLARFAEADWAPLLAGVETIVNCAGALQDGPRDDMAAVHIDGLRRLLAAARSVGVHRIVQVSTAGAETAAGAFGWAKQGGEQVVTESGLRWVILRPGLVLAPGAYGGSALLRGLAALPIMIPCVHPDSLVQVVGVDDIARAAVAAAQPTAPSGLTVELVSPEPLALRDILTSLRAWLGLAPAPVLAMPAWSAAFPGVLADALAWLGWLSPMRTATIAQLRQGVRADPAGGDALGLGRTRTLAEILAAAPAGVQERWFAKLYFLKPLGLAVLVVFWAWSGMVGLLRADVAVQVLTDGGFSPPLAGFAVLGGSLVDLALAALICHRRSTKRALQGMIAVSLGYIAAGSFCRPDLWLDPLGAFAKVVPQVILCLVMLAMLDSR